MTKVAVAGIAEIKREKALPQARERLYYNLAKEIYEKLSITPDDVDTFIFSSNDFMDGRTISEVYLVQRVGAYMKDESKVEAESLNAVTYAVMRILSGNYKTALVISASKSGSEFKPFQVQNQVLDPVYERPRGLLNFVSGPAFQTKLYMEKYGVSIEDMTLFVEKNLRSAQSCPTSISELKALSVSDILSSEPMYEPVRRAHLPEFADGGCAVFLTAEDVAERFTKNPVWIDGMGWCSDTYWFGERDLLGLSSLRKASSMAYRMAGVENPEKDISFAEVYTNVGTEEPILLEAMGLCEEGKAVDKMKDGVFAVDGELPVNPSGGAFGGHVYNVTGLYLFVDAVKQLLGEAGGGQVKNPGRAVVHSQEGVSAQFNTVVLLSV